MKLSLYQNPTYRLLAAVCLIAFVHTNVNAQDGPGGVGSLDASESLKLWLDADSATVNASNQVTAWDNRVSVSELNMSPFYPANLPNFVASKLNNHAAISFENVNDVLRSESTLNYNYFPQNQATTFLVTQHDNLSQHSNSYGTILDSTDTPFGSGSTPVNRFSSHMPWDGTIYADLGQCCGAGARVQYTYQADWLTEGSVFTHRTGGGYAKTGSRNNVVQRTGDSTTTNFNNPGNFRFMVGQSVTGHFRGDISEFIMYHRAINDAQMVIVHNYLASKHGLTIDEDHYLFQASHGEELIGIGQKNDSVHTESQSAKIFTIKGATTLSNGEYVFTGHDNASIASWTSDERINGDDQLERIAREWRFDETGDVGTITIGIDPSLLPALPSGAYYTLWIDNDGDFTSGAVAQPLTNNSGVYEASGIDVVDGMFVTIAVFTPEVNFVSTSLTVEEGSQATFTVSMNHAIDQAISVPYTVSGTYSGTAPAAGNFDIPIGSTSASLDFTPPTNSSYESDETVILTLTSGGVVLGASAESTLTVQDDGAAADVSVSFEAPFNYAHKQTITIDSDMVSGSEALTDFPMMIRISGTDLTTLENDLQSSSAFDIRFTLENSFAWLDHQIEVYTAGTEYIAWVRIPSLSATSDTRLEMYYGNSAVTTDPSVATVFDDSYESVYHLENGSNASGSNNDLTDVGSPTYESGRIGNGVTLSNTSELTSSSSDLEVSSSDSVSFSTWFKGTDNNARILSKTSSSGGDAGYLFRLKDSHFDLVLKKNSSEKIVVEGNENVSDGDWHHLIITYNGSASSTGVSLYVDGEPSGIATGSQDNLSLSDNIVSSENFDLGMAMANGGNPLAGSLDELRVVRRVLSTDWIRTEYNNIENYSTVVSLESSETVSGFLVPEAASTLDLIVSLSAVSSDAVTVNYSVTGGSASNSTDYVLAASSVTIPAGSLRATVSLEIRDDNQDEADEEDIIVSLSNPSSDGTSNVSLGSDKTITITMEDNDAVPVASFLSTELSSNEGSSDNSITVGLSSLSGRDVGVDYTVASSGATSGSDYLLSNGTLTIPAGQLSGNIAYNVLDDTEIEVTEDFTVTLSSATNASLAGSGNVATVSIKDNDNVGIEGPGGIGNLDGSGTLVMWMIADSVTNTGNNTDVTAWPNEVALSNMDMAPAGTAPTYVENVLNGHSAVSFADGADDALRTSALSASTFPFNQGSFFIVYSSDDATQRSRVLHLTNQRLIFEFWAGNVNADFGRVNGVNNQRVQFPYQSSWTGGGLFSWIASSSDDTEVFRNGNLEGSRTSVGTIDNHTARTLGFGVSSTDNFSGDIMEFIAYSREINVTQRIITENYLAAKYGLTISNDYWAFDANHSTGVAGIGRESATDFHTSAESGIVGISNPSTLTDGDYLFIGHDNAAADTWRPNDVPSSDVRRLAREWRVDVQGSPGTISIGIDAGLLPSLPSGFVDYVIIVDGDGIFSSGGPVLYPVTLVDGEYVANLVEVSQGSFFTIGVINRTVEFIGASSQFFENENNSISVSLSLVSSEDIVIPFTVSGSATSGSDYSLSNSSSITILAGNTEATLELGIIDDSELESDETIEISLGTPPSGVVLGSNVNYTYTINDDDNDRSVFIDHFAYSRSISVDQNLVTGSHTDFPLMISIASDNDLRHTSNGGHVESMNGFDIVFQLSDGTFLDHDLEQYSASTGALVAWVRLPTLSNSSEALTFNMLYGNAGIEFNQSATGAWNSDYLGVWHMSDDNYEDATSHGLDGVDFGSGSVSSGKIGGSASFNGSSQIRVANVSDLNFGVDDAYTLSTWYKGTGGNQTLFGMIDDNTSPAQGYGITLNSGGLPLGWRADDSGTGNMNGGSTINDGSWNHVVVVYDGSSGVVYVNGVAGSTLSNSLTGTLSPNISLSIGSRLNGASVTAGLVGELDEVRISTSALSADWVSTEYANQNNSSFVTVSGTEVSNSSVFDLLEDVGSVSVTVRVDPVDNSQATTLDYSSAGTSSATLDSDYRFTGSGSVSIASGSRTGTFTFDLINDLTNESDETVVIAVSNPSSNAGLGSINSQTYTIGDDDGSPVVSFSSVSSTAYEGSGVLQLTVLLDAASGVDVSVDYSVQSGSGTTATSGSDFVASTLSGTLTIAAGDLSGTISFQTIDDSDVETDPETVTIELTNPSNATLGSSTEHVVTIADNDGFSGIEGPGGVGSVENSSGEGLLKLWLIGDSVEVASGKVSSWNNLVKNISVDYDMIPTVSSTPPSVVTDAVNGHTEISFADVSDALVSTGFLNSNSFSTNELTMFVVTRPDNLNQDSYLYATHTATAGAVNNTSILASVPNSNASPQYYFGLGTDTYTGTYESSWTSSHSIFTHVVSSDTFMIYRNNGVLLNRDDADGSFSGFTTKKLYLGKDGGSGNFQGDIAEVIMFNRDINVAQTKIINNYLAAKYDLTISDDYYNYQSSHGNDVAGIGREDVNNTHVQARAGVVSISNASSLGDGEYVMFGHDNALTTSWLTSEVPFDGVSRVSREWRFDATGDPGTISIGLSSALLPNRTNGDEDYVILVDSDGDFSSGATTYKTVLVDGIHTASSIAISSGDYVTVGIVSRIVSFTSSTGSGSETEVASAALELNLESSSNIEIGYTITGGTATNGSVDFSLAVNGTVTFIAGQTSVTIPLGIINDSDIENSETIELTLNTPPSGVSLSNTVFTYTINDDDNSRQVSFEADPASSTVGEDADTLYVVVELNEVDASNATTVGYTVSGGSTESSPSPDYTLADGTLTIEAGESTDSIAVVILDDVLSEGTETLEISLENPTNAGLGSRSTYTYTITDNDTPPTVAFTSATTTIDEGGSVANIAVSLSTLSGQDVTVEYAVNASSSATGGGSDYALADGTLTIPKGSQQATINVSLTDDDLEESSETVVIDLSSPSGATLGTQTIHTVTITDNDAAFGYYGPGGVGDRTSTLLWLDATAVNGKGFTNVADGASVSTWKDRSGNAYDFTAIGTAPVFDQDGLNSNNSVSISASQPGYVAPSGFTNALSNYGFVSVLSQASGDYIAETNTSATGLFSLSQSGNAYSLDGTSYLPSTSSTDEDINTWIFNAGSSDSDSLAMFYRDGSLIANGPNYEVMPIGNNFSLGSRHGDATQGAGDFSGFISEFIVFRNVINDAQRIIIENYLANKYGLTISNDYYAHQGSHGHDIVGIGQSSDGSNHLQSMSDSLLLISSPSALDNDEYVFMGHDNGATSWVNTEVPDNDVNFERISREWIMSVTGTPGTVVLSIDADLLATPSTNFNQYILYTDSDGDFRSGATAYRLSLSALTGFYVSEPVTISDDMYVTIGVGRPVVEFAATSSIGAEDGANPNLEVALNFTLSADVTVDYAIDADNTSDDAIGGNVDYNLTPGTLTISSGQTSATVPLSVINDTAIESDEDVAVVLSNPSSNVQLGSSTSHTFTINDNDSGRSIDFASASGTGAEGVGTVTVTVEIDPADPVNASTVDLEVVSDSDSSATVTEDYTLSATTLTFAAAATTASFDLTVVDNSSFENDETVTIRLSDPTNASLGTIKEYVYTITDDDTAPTVGFTNASSVVNESGGSATIEVSLSSSISSDVTVSYTVAATATSGEDYTFSDGTLTIPSDSTSSTLSPAIINDAVAEGIETITLTLSAGPTNATLGSQTTHTLTIFDDDQGSTGPGGVGATDGTSSLVLWLDAGQEVYSDAGTTLASNSDAVRQWNDLSGNDNHASQTNTNRQPSLNSTGVNAQPTLDFDDDFIDHSFDLNIGTSSATYLFVLQVPSSANMTLLQQLDRGGTGRTNLQLISTNDFRSFIGGVVQTSTTSYTAGDWEIYSSSINSNGSSSSLFFYHNGNAAGTNTGFTTGSSTGSWVTGANKNKTSNFLTGSLSEVIVFNTNLDVADLIIMHNYLSAKYGTTLDANDVYNEDADGFDFNVAGIGRIDSDNLHVDAQGTGILRVLNPTDLDDNEFMMWGDDNASLSVSGTDVPAGVDERFARVWSVSEVSNTTSSSVDVGAVDLRFDMSGVSEISPGNFARLRLLVDTDADGDFTDATIVEGISALGDNVYQFSGVTALEDNARFTLGVINSVQTGPGGVGSTDGNSSLVLWLKADSEDAVDGATLGSWSDQSGNSHDFNAGNGAVFLADTVNGYPALDFNGTSNYFERTYTAALNPSNYSVFTTTHLDEALSSTIDILSNRSKTGSASGGFQVRVTSSNRWTFETGNSGSSSLDNLEAPDDANNTDGVWADLQLHFDTNDASTGKSLYINNSFIASSATSAAMTNDTNPFRIGAGKSETTPDNYYIGDIGEVIMYNSPVNSAQRIIVSNYLAAKYGYSLSANDVYNEDDNGNGDFDHDVAGIGRVDASNIHNNARGSGIFTFLNPSDLGNNEFLMWGHNNGLLQENNSNVPRPADIDYLWSRLWRMSETGDVGTVDIRVDLTGFSPVVTSNLRLLVDTDTDFSDATVIDMATSLGNNVYQFTGVSIADNNYFTLGSSDKDATPLPVELLSFKASPSYDNSKVALHWSTASETNNDYFEIERSSDGFNYSLLANGINGQGTTSALSKYSYTDTNPLLGQSYYRLVQVDYDGEAEVFDPVMVDLQSFEDEMDALLIPNPVSKSSDLGVRISNGDDSAVSVWVYNLQGIEVYYGTINPSDFNESTTDYTMSLPEGMMSGMYHLVIRQGSRISVEKLVVY